MLYKHKAKLGGDSEHIISVITAKLTFNNPEDEAKLSDLCRRWSAAYRYAYNRLIELNKEKKRDGSLYKILVKIFYINSWYALGAVHKAESLLSRVKVDGRNPRKIIFGSRSLFEEMKKHSKCKDKYGKLRRKFEERRKGNLYTLGSAQAKGNLNLRIMPDTESNRLRLRIAIGNREFIYANIKCKGREEEIKNIALSGKPYSVQITKRNGNFYVHFQRYETLPSLEHTQENGVIGIDINAHPLHVAWAEVDYNGNLVSYGKVPMPELHSGNANKRDYYQWIYAHRITDIAREKNKAIVIEKLHKMRKNKKGDFSGRRLRRIQHNFPYRSLLEKIERTAKRKGVEVVYINPEYTSVQGILKYAPQHMISKDVAAAYVIGRRGLGLKEKLPKYCKDILRKTNKDVLEKLKQKVSKLITNAYKQQQEYKQIGIAIKSLETEPGRMSRPLDGTSLGVRYPWLVLKVVALTALSPEIFSRRKTFRDVSILKRLLYQGSWGKFWWCDNALLEHSSSWG